MIKVLETINSLATGGAEKLLLESLPLYNEKGIRADLLLLNGNDQPFLAKLERKNCCTIYKLSDGSVYNPLLIFKIIPFLKKYDVVHVHLFPSLYWVAIAKMLSFSKVKLVYTEHSTTNYRRTNFLFKLIDKLVYAQYFKIISITDLVQNNLKNHLDFTDDTKFQIIQNGLNLDKIKNAQALNKLDFFPDAEAKIIIQVARFFEPKDHQTLIKSLQFLPQNIKLLLVGDGILLDDCKLLVNQLKLQDRVAFLGLRNDVLQLLKTSDIVVLSSKHEGLSLSAIEAMASGKPFVASSVEGLKEMVDGVGVLFELGNEKQLAEKINHLLNDTFIYDKIVSQCEKKAAEYDINKMIDSYISIYKESVK